MNLIEQDKNGVWHQTSEGMRISHEINHMSGGQWQNPVTGECGNTVPRVARWCKFCNPRTWRWHKFLFLLRVNPLKAYTAIWSEF